MNELDYQFTQDWFVQNIPIWNELLPRYNPQKVLEVGSFEGRSACYFIENCAKEHPFELHCIDSWDGGIEHDPGRMPAVEARFDHNIAVAKSRVAHKARVIKHKSLSHAALAKLMVVDPVGTFDVVYIDGSHQAPDVLTDAVMAFKLLRVGGLLIFDDYLWSLEKPGRQDSLTMPKPAIDAFLNLFQRKMVVVQGVPLYQVFATKFFA